MKFPPTGSRSTHRRTFSPLGRLFLGAIALLLLSGCALILGPRRDRTRFYTLAAPLPTAESAAEALSDPILLRGVETPGYLRAKPMVVRREDNEIDYLDRSWWSEEFDLAAAGILREELSRQGFPMVGRRDEVHALELTVQIQRAEGWRAEGGNYAVLAASFELRRDDGSRRLVSRGTFDPEPLEWKGDAEDLALRLGEAIAGLAAAIGDSITP